MSVASFTLRWHTQSTVRQLTQIYRSAANRTFTIAASDRRVGRIDIPSEEDFIFTAVNFRAPDLRKDLSIVDVSLTEVHSNADLAGFGKIVHTADDISVWKKHFLTPLLSPWL
jgi:hypothetical protein